MTINDELLDSWPGVRIDSDNAAYYAGLLEHRLLINRCEDCGRWHNPPRSVCPACWSRNVTATEVSGRGTVDLLTFVHLGPRRGGVDYSQGHPVVGVALDEQEGLRVSSTVVGVPRDEIQLGMRVQLTWPDTGEEPPSIAFEPVSP